MHNPPMPDPTEAPRMGVRRATELIREVREVSQEFELHLGRQLTVNPTDLQAMEHLIQSGPLGPTELARRLGISTAAVTAVVDRLVALGHVTRTQHPTDRRGIVVVPAPKSVTRAMEALIPMIRGIDGVLDDFEPDEQATITAYLEQVLSVYRAQMD
ncbi:MAG: MarR family winged helix-turn-helix transcriptional regulator [Rhodoglobus sp.]